MKNNYTKPMMAISRFDMEDIVTESVTKTQAETSVESQLNTYISEKNIEVKKILTF